tara:strand:- start:285 stop:551 length:267 start_codon:yes stop_codon:yes gene_type:complete
VELVVVELEELDKMLVQQERQTLVVEVVELVIDILQELILLVEQVVQVSWLLEHQEAQEFILQHVVHVHQLLLQMEQTKLQNLKHQQI